MSFPCSPEEKQPRGEQEDGVVYPYRHGDGTGLEVRLVPVTAWDPSVGGPSVGDPEDDPEGGDARATTKKERRKTRQQRRKDATRAWTE